jgi:hypothetical protein
MGCRKFKPFIIFTTAVLLLSATGAMAELSTTCTFNEESGYIVYSVSDGEDLVEYIVKDSVFQPACLSVVGDPPGLTGPNDIDSVQLNCDLPGGGAKINIQICKETLCFATYDLYFVCEENCHIRRVREQIPTTTTWGIIILSLILLSGAIYFLRRKKVKATV